ncbi:MAG: oxidoreductase [Hamadaea sp.]|nr:oxidoreductase [Hamadaea sp.]
MRRLTTIVSLVAVATLTTSLAPGSAYASGRQRPQPSWQDFATDSTSSLRGLSPVSRRIAWASGSGGEVLRTVDGGRTWQHVGPPDTAELQFRDIQAFDADHAVILSIGEGTDSRIYTTADGGASWTESFRNAEPAAFYDCLTFFDHRHGLALSDPVDGRFRLLSTDDGGRSWSIVPGDGMPAALAGEFAFAASGTCIVSTSGRDAWFATGGGATSRVFRSADRGRTWTVADSPMPSGASAGIYSLAFRDPRHGIAVGGDYAAPDSAPNGAAWTADGGRTWVAADGVPGEYRSGVAWTKVPGVAIAVGPTGSDITWDGGRTWHRFETGSLHGVQCTDDGACWASGADGRIARLALS